MTMLPEIIGWSTVGLALVAGLALAAHKLSCYRFVRRMRLHACDADPIGAHILLLVPCKGTEIELAENLAGLFNQERVSYELRFIVESDSDPAARVIEHLRRRHPGVPSSIVVAGYAAECGQKVHNLRVATANLPPKYRILAFADSDIRPGPLWLHSLTHVLCRPGVGASTGYRWFVPKRLTLANLLVFSLNAAAAACLGRREYNLIWGGSWAIHRDFFEQTGMREAWWGTLNDDLVATRVVRGAKLKIDFEPQCLCMSPLDVTWPQALNFIHRQLLQARFYTPRHFWSGAWMVFLQAAALIASVCLATGVLTDGEWNGLGLGAFAALSGLTSLRILVGHLAWREKFAEADRVLLRARAMDVAVGWAFPLIASLCLLRTCLSNTMVWRGIRYRLDGGGRMMFLGRQLDVHPLHQAPVEADEPVILTLPSRRAA